jgi:hypothetical protein
MLVAIVTFIIVIFILYIVIETAVRRGINSSIIGQYLEEESETKKKKSLFDEDLDNE